MVMAMYFSRLIFAFQELWMTNALYCCLTLYPNICCLTGKQFNQNSWQGNHQTYISLMLENQTNKDPFENLTLCQSSNNLSTFSIAFSVESCFWLFCHNNVKMILLLVWGWFRNSLPFCKRDFFFNYPSHWPESNKRWWFPSLY